MATQTSRSEFSYPNPFRSRLALAVGLAVYLAAQGFLVNAPLWNRPLPPELDDSITYVLKTKLLQEGLWRKVSPAMADLQQQLHLPVDDPAATRQQALAGSRLFPFYHPIFSFSLIALNSLGLDLTTAFKVVWSLGPLIFGLALAYFLTSLFGAAAAGLALILLAFKVFPDSGLHCVVPSNLAMALAVLIWGRLVKRQGQAPWTLALGSLALVLMHPIGAIYAVMSVVLACLLADPQNRRTPRLLMLATLAAVALLLVLSSFEKIPFIPNLLKMPGSGFSPVAMARGAAHSALEVIASIVRTGGGLFGSPPLFLAASALGLFTLPGQARRAVVRILSVNLVFLGGVLFYLSNHPADIFLRLWIPLVVVLFGLVGHALVFAWRLSVLSWPDLRDHPGRLWSGGLKLLLPALLAALLTGYAVEMSVKGAEIIATTAEYLKTNQPLDFSPTQPRLLLSLARPGDKVFYNSIIIMPYFLSQGASRLGAVYFHPAFQAASGLSRWLSLPELRFAAVYNPLVYHPSFAGRDEHKWWLLYPDFYFSPLSRPNKFGPLARNGHLEAADFRWLELEVRTGEAPKLLRVNITNPGGPSSLELLPISEAGAVIAAGKITAPVPALWSGWLSLDLSGAPQVKRYRIVLPAGAPSLRINGLSFGGDRLLWPWKQKAGLTLMPRADPGEITVSFDPAALLPAPLRDKKITILDDRGSAVLLQVE